MIVNHLDIHFIYILHFIEDLQVSRTGHYAGGTINALCQKGTNVVDKVKGMIGGLVHGAYDGEGIEFVYCMRDACVIRKK